MEPVPRIVPIYENRRLQRPFWNLSFEKMLGRVAELGFDCVEIETGAYPGSVHREVEKLLTSKGAARDFLKQVHSLAMAIRFTQIFGSLAPTKPQLCTDFLVDP
jgi:hypothetical protein